MIKIWRIPKIRNGGRDNFIPQMVSEKKSITDFSKTKYI
jgi:hypothetical protein